MSAELVTAGSHFAAAVHQWLTRPALADADLADVRAALLTEDPMPAEPLALVRRAAEAAASHRGGPA